MKKEKTIKFAILGCGGIAKKMAKAVKTLEEKGMGIEAYAVASRCLEKGVKFCQDYGFKKAYNSYQELAEDPIVDLIYIATPHSEHYSNILLCLKYEKNLLVEKAFTANALMASEVIAFAQEKGVFLCEAVWTRFLPVLETIKKRIQEGFIGKLESIEANFSIPLTHIERLTNPNLAGGALLDLGIYDLTFADLFLTDENIEGCENNYIKQINSKCVKYYTGVDGTDWIDLIYANGQIAHLKTSITSSDINEGLIYGTKGFIRIQNINNMEQIEFFDDNGKLIDTLKPKPIENFYEYEVLACKKAIENHLKECKQMPLKKTIEMMTLMDSLRDKWKISYPFEISPAKVWNRFGDKSFLEIYDIESGKSSLLKTFDVVIEAPNWSPDGNFITYNSEGSIYKYELSTGHIIKVESYFVCNCNNDHLIAPDGSGVFVSHHTHEDGLSRIYKIFFDGRMPELITPLAPSYLHGISPDGQTLVYCAERNGEYDIYAIPSKGGTETRLTFARGLNDGPEYDCMGENIWFNSVRTGRMQAWKMKSDGTEQTQMTFDVHWNSWFPHVSPDGKKVVVLAYHEKDVRPGEHVPNKNVEIRLMTQNENSSWSQPKTLLKIFGGQGTINVNSWAKDSKRFAYIRYEH